VPAPDRRNGRTTLGHRELKVLERSIPCSTRLAGLYVALAVAGFYFVADNLLNKVALGDGWQIFWPLNGVTIALLIMRPRKDWPLLLAAVSLGTGSGEYMDGNSLGATLLQRGLSVLEVSLSAALLPRFISLDSWLRSPGLYPRFAAAVIVGPALSGLLAAVHLHAQDGRPFVAAFNSWAVADAMGIAAVLPLVLALRSTQIPQPPESGPNGSSASGRSWRRLPSWGPSLPPASTP